MPSTQTANPEAELLVGFPIAGIEDQKRAGAALLAQGCRNTTMAERLFVSESTVRTHLRNINLKLHAANRTEAAVIGRRLGLIP